MVSRLKRRLLALPRLQKQALALAVDIAMSLLATWLAFSLRLEVRHVPAGLQWLPYAVSAFLFIPFFVKLGLYHAIFRYSGASSLSSIAAAVGIYGMVYFIVLIFGSFPSVPRSIGILQPILFFSLAFGSRVIAAQMLKRASHGAVETRNVLVYGAGEAGAQAVESLSMTPAYRVCGFLDDDAAKQGRRLNGHTIFAPASAAEVIRRHEVTDILIALPSASVERRREIINSLADLHVRVRTIPGILDLARGNTSGNDVQELQIIDLLERAPISSTIDAHGFEGRTVLVTGAGGSIGSELCRQLLLLMPETLVLVDHNEFGLYAIDQELRMIAANRAIATKIQPCLGSVRDERRMEVLFSRHKPQLVYHAAAYKHVPLVEANALEAATNNVLGTLIVAEAARRHDAARFTLISTDKAVRPTNFMGASKRLAEQVVQAFAEQAGTGGGTVFSMVRFGNVLGSSGSVVPLFRRQITAGGPVTITDPEVIRYFMTIPEAVGLVLQSSQMAEGGEVFVLDMGQPVKIIDLARKMIRLSGMTERTPEHPEGEIEIAIIGLRPGEKLYEELLIGDNPQPTASPHIMKARESFLSWPELEIEIGRLRRAVDEENMELLNRVLPRVSSEA